MAEKRSDHRTDPAHDVDHDVDEGDDWASEGGAVNEGPATHPADADPDAVKESDGTED